jgi:putative transposase
MKMFRLDRDFEAFERIMLEAHQRHPIRILSYCVMSNHWHFVLWPDDDDDGQVTRFVRWLTHTHAMRWRVSHRTVGYGHLYQGRFKSFPVQTDQHLLTLCRYVERNPLSAGLVKRAERWRWSSLWARLHGSDQQKSILSPWPVDRGRDWTGLVNGPFTQTQREAVETSLKRGRPLGSTAWTREIVSRLDLAHTTAPEGRPSKQEIA